MNVFVLGTGRCGTVTFTEACRHFTNYTVGHESRSALWGADRVAYPDGHIEADNRLTWFLPQLEHAMRDRDVVWVHLLRDREATARSFLKRFGSSYRASIITAFSRAMVQHPEDWDEADHIELCRYYVDTVTWTIERFLRDKPHLTVHLESMPADFDRVVEAVGAHGDLDAARAEWGTLHNAS